MLCNLDRTHMSNARNDAPSHNALPHEPLYLPPYATTSKLERMQHSHVIARAHVEAGVSQRLAFRFLYKGEHSSVPLKTPARRRLAAWALREEFVEAVQPSMMATYVANAAMAANNVPLEEREAVFDKTLKAQMEAGLTEAKKEYGRRCEAIRQQAEFEIIVQRAKELAKELVPRTDEDVS